MKLKTKLKFELQMHHAELIIIIELVFWILYLLSWVSGQLTNGFLLKTGSERLAHEI